MQVSVQSVLLSPPSAGLLLACCWPATGLLLLACPSELCTIERDPVEILSELSPEL